jgi:hypothetical protein
MNDVMQETQMNVAWGIRYLLIIAYLCDVILGCPSSFFALNETLMNIFHLFWNVSSVTVFLFSEK